MPSPKHLPSHPPRPGLSQAPTSCLTFSGHTAQAIQGACGHKLPGDRGSEALTTGSHRKVLPRRAMPPSQARRNPKHHRARGHQPFLSSEWSHCSGGPQGLKIPWVPQRQPPHWGAASSEAGRLQAVPEGRRKGTPCQVPFPTYSVCPPRLCSGQRVDSGIWAHTSP